MGNRSDRRRAALESLKEGHQRRMEKYRKQYEQRRKFYRLLKENASDMRIFRRQDIISSMEPCRFTDIASM